MGEHRHWTALFTASLQQTDSVLLRGSSGVQDRSPSGRVPICCNGGIVDGPSSLQSDVAIRDVCACFVCQPDRVRAGSYATYNVGNRDVGPAQTSVDSPIPTLGLPNGNQSAA